jgi:hypothetical protein
LFVNGGEFAGKKVSLIQYLIFEKPYCLPYTLIFARTTSDSTTQFIAMQSPPAPTWR